MPLYFIIFTLYRHISSHVRCTTINITIISYFMGLTTSKKGKEIDFSDRLLAAEATTLPFSGGRGPERAETALRSLCHRSLRANGYIFYKIPTINTTFLHI